MRSPSECIYPALITVLLVPVVFGASVHVSSASQSIGGPVLGFVPDAERKAVHPVMGIPGASFLGERLKLDIAVRGVVISPKQDYAIAARIEDGQIVVLQIATDPPAVIPVDNAHTTAGLTAISPTGSAAAVYNDASGAVQVIRGLPLNPAVVGELDASDIFGRASSLAVSDDGSIALLRTVDAAGPGLWVLNALNVPRRFPLDGPSAVAFFPNKWDAVVTDAATRSAFVILDIGRTAIPAPLISDPDGVDGFSSAWASDDGRSVFLADSTSGVIAIVDMQTRSSVIAACDCTPTGIYPLQGSTALRLTDVTREPIVVLDASAGGPRFVVVPPAIRKYQQSQ